MKPSIALSAVWLVAVAAVDALMVCTCRAKLTRPVAAGAAEEEEAEVGAGAELAGGKVELAGDAAAAEEAAELKTMVLRVEVAAGAGELVAFEADADALDGAAELDAAAAEVDESVGDAVAVEAAAELQGVQGRQTHARSSPRRSRERTSSSRCNDPVGDVEDLELGEADVACRVADARNVEDRRGERLVGKVDRRRRAVVGERRDGDDRLVRELDVARRDLLQ